MRIRLILFCVVAGLVSVSPLYGAVTVDFTRDVGAMKPLHGVNNSPNRLKGALPEFAVAGIPYARLHDTCGPFGGAHYVDVPNVFPDFDADENDPKSYDFAFTDAYLKPIVASGCKPFYRLGVTIENSAGLKAYNVYPPKDFAKWARICEHIIRHYNEGWAKGFRWGIEYWEIWNEPESNTMWRGSTREAFFEFYRTAALHLKAKFPDIKVGGYGSTGFLYADHEGIAEWPPERERMTKRWLDWFEAFCDYVSAPETRAPVDFFSWHLYLREGSGTGPELIARHAELARKALDAHGMEKTESILDEWNWRPRHFWDEMKGNVGAACVAASFCVMQRAPVDKAMYYDAYPQRRYCGLFYWPSERTTPCYEAFVAYNRLFVLGRCAETKSDEAGVHACAATDGSKRVLLLVNNTGERKIVRPSITLPKGVGGTFAGRIVHETSPVPSPIDPFVSGDPVVMPPYSFVIAEN